MEEKQKWVFDITTEVEATEKDAQNMLEFLTGFFSDFMKSLPVVTFRPKTEEAPDGEKVSE